MDTGDVAKTELGDSIPANRPAPPAKLTNVSRFPRSENVLKFLASTKAIWLTERMQGPARITSWPEHTVNYTNACNSIISILKQLLGDLFLTIAPLADV